MALRDELLRIGGEDAEDLRQEILQRIDAGLYQLSAKAETEGDEDDFITEELIIALILAGAIDDVAPQIEEKLDAAGDDANRVMQAIDAAGQIAVAAYTVDTAVKVRAQVLNALNKGADKMDARYLLSVHARQRILDGMNRSSMYYTNNYFNRFVMPELFKQVEKVIDGVDGATMAVVRETLNKRLKTVPYWKMVANQAASRAYHYGFLQGAKLARYTQYQFVAVMDDKTTDLCRSLNGKVFSVNEGIQWTEKIAELQDPSLIADLQPSFTKEEAKALADYSSEQLMAMGVMVPPLHVNCRSSIILLQ